MLPTSTWQNCGNGMGHRPLEKLCARLAIKLDACTICDIKALDMIFITECRRQQADNDEYRVAERQRLTCGTVLSYIDEKFRGLEMYFLQADNICGKVAGPIKSRAPGDPGFMLVESRVRVQKTLQIT